MIGIKEEYKNRVTEMIDELRTYCQMHCIPMYATAALKNSEGKTDYETAVFAPGANGIVLDDDRIRKHLLVDCGFALIPGREYHEISGEELALLGGDDSG